VTIQDQAQKQAERSKRADDLRLAVADVDQIHILEDSLSKIVGELVSNAFKFSKPGTPVEVSAAVEDNAYTIRVKDSGFGMSAQQIIDIGAYMQFQRKLYEQQGLGLGLSIVNGLLSIFGGTMDLQSEVNQGTVVTVCLRLAPPPGA
jgi:signal transduction histidine kinase